MKSYNVIITACKDGAQSRIKNVYNRERKRRKMQCFPFWVKRKNPNEKQRENKKSSKNNQNIDHWEKLRKKMYGFQPLCKFIREPLSKKTYTDVHKGDRYFLLHKK